MNKLREKINLFFGYIWKDLPTHLKNSSASSFPKKFIWYLLSEQQIKYIIVLLRKPHSSCK